jgi:DNA-binding MarR family transcriptional regulator
MAASVVSRKARAKIGSRAQRSNGMHEYFVAVARVRYIMRKVFRMVDDHAKKLGLDPLAHQALLQVYGSPRQGIRVSALAERLDIVPPFASNIVKQLVEAKLLRRKSDASDMRVSIVMITDAGRTLCREIDWGARLRVDALIGQLDAKERKVALSMLMFYVGPGAPRSGGRRRNGSAFAARRASR